jgi:VWFA-related protein
VVRDLTAADFEILQDGKPQKVTFAQFVPVMTAAAAAPPAAPAAATAAAAAPKTAAAAGSRATPASSTTSPITRDQMRRTMLIVVDDLGLSVDGMNNVRQGLRGFVDTNLLPTDLVAIVRTGASSAMMQPLTNDREVLHAAIDALRYNNLSRKGVQPTGDVVQGLLPPEVDEVPALQRSVSTAGSLAALSLVVQGAQDLPGRKTVIFASEGFRLTIGTDAESMPDVDPRVRSSVDHVIDQATRSGVVIYAIDGQDLQTGRLRASDDIHWVDASRNSDAMGEVLRRLGADRLRSVRDSQEGLAYLAEQTGGFAIVNTNDLAKGMGRITADVRDYYVIGYEPDRATFVGKDKPPQFHTIAVNVKRAGVRVRTRKQFIGVSDPELPAVPTPAQELLRAAMSPFSTHAISVRATNLPGYSNMRGNFVRTVLHLYARALTFIPDPAGGRTATVDLVGLAFDSDGAQVHEINTGFDITLKDEAAGQALESGLVYTARMPIAKPGGYQIRFAIRDRRSGAVGSAGGFVTIPDVTGGAFALSGLVLSAGNYTGATEPLDSDRFTVGATDALQVYAPGTSLSYSCEIYNAGTKVQAVTSLMRGPETIFALPPGTLQVPPGSGLFSASGGLKLPADLPAGTYVLQITATTDDATQAKKTRAAVQSLSFDVR